MLLESVTMDEFFAVTWKKHTEGNSQEAIRDYLEQFARSDDAVLKGCCYIKIADVLYDQGEQEAAFDYYSKSLAYYPGQINTYDRMKKIALGKSAYRKYVQCCFRYIVNLPKIVVEMHRVLTLWETQVSDPEQTYIPS